MLRTGSNSHEPTGNDATRLRAALHPINGDQKIWPLKYFHKSVQDDALVIPRPAAPECAARLPEELTVDRSFFSPPQQLREVTNFP